MSKLCFVFNHPAAFLCLYIYFFCGMLFMVTWLYVHFFLSVFRVIVQARSCVLFQHVVLFFFVCPQLGMKTCVILQTDKQNQHVLSERCTVHA